MNILNLFQTLQNNPIFNVIRLSKNPQHELINLMEKNTNPNNEFTKNVLDIVKNGKNKQAELMARNMLKEAGLDPDEIYRQVSSIGK